MLRILIVDDHYIVGEGTKTILTKGGDISAHYVSSGAEALALSEEFDIYIIDIHMPVMTGIDLSRELLSINARRKIILYTGFTEQENLYIFTEIGVSGIISKTATKSELIDLIQAVVSGYTIVPLSLFKNKNKLNSESKQHGLTERELIILKEISKGLSNREIADKLFLSDRTVEYRLTKIYRKLGVKSRIEALNIALDNKFFE
ncbi:response regulator transcription factor [Ornithinibacillus massiliensis]|uniref:Response regulator transcription factor n=1 Tax=Ornithinibacillus massiliensis TaxID=1944633 RepID=A0ABS5MA03_9BACI|nr:response regulator transcription factor [Ornithinibacillus massiliensis]MBS3678767.1 response regulator transcription factor [Ornithinibacillus massiliensis]